MATTTATSTIPLAALTTPPGAPSSSPALSTTAAATPTSAPAQALQAALTSSQCPQPPITPSTRAHSFQSCKKVCSSIEIWVLYITVISLAIAVLGLPYMLESTRDSHDGLALAKWTAAKDFREYCLSLNVSIPLPHARLLLTSRRRLSRRQCLRRVDTHS
jgi:hypothetical protein